MNTSAVRGVPRDTNVDSVFNGVFVPKGTHIQLDFYNVQNSTHWWQNPSEFNPERFATNGEAFDLKGEGMKFAAFGGGTRQCFVSKNSIEHPTYRSPTVPPGNEICLKFNECRHGYDM